MLAASEGISLFSTDAMLKVEMRKMVKTSSICVPTEKKYKISSISANSMK